MASSFQMCPVCRSVLYGEHFFAAEKQATHVDCPRCGPFWLEWDSVQLLDRGPLSEGNGFFLSHFIKTQGKRDFRLSLDEISRILDGEKRPSIAVKADNLIEVVGDESLKVGLKVSVNHLEHGAKIGLQSFSELHLLVEEMGKQNLLRGNLGEWYDQRASNYSKDGRADVMLTLSGWERYEEIKKGKVYNNTVFMALKFGEEIEDYVYKFFRPAVSQCGLDLKTGKDDPQAGIVTDRMIVDIRSCRLMVADLSHGNNGVYWEAGFAHGLGKSVLFTCRKTVMEGRDKDTPAPHFDISHHQIIPWDPEQPKEAAERLKDAIRATCPDVKQVDD